MSTIINRNKPTYKGDFDKKKYLFKAGRVLTLRLELYTFVFATPIMCFQIKELHMWFSSPFPKVLCSFAVQLLIEKFKLFVTVLPVMLEDNKFAFLMYY